MKIKTAAYILDFWFNQATEEFWFQKSISFDDDLKIQFMDIYNQAVKGKLDGWISDPLKALALILILDQFSRNMFRDTPKAFATDAKALEIAKILIANNQDHELTYNKMRVFIYMPFMHSENKSDQQQGLDLYQNLAMEEQIKFMQLHKNIIDKFARFPHRNKILSRISTPAEIDFLTQPNSSF